MLTLELRELIKSTIESIDESEVRMRKKSNLLPVRTVFYNKMSDKEIKTIRKLCEKYQLDGAIVAFAGFKEKDGFVFTTKGFLATKEYFYKGSLIKKQIPMPIIYKEIEDIHQCSKNDKGGSPIYCSLTLKRQKEQISCVPLYGAYISIVVNDILNAIRAAEEEEKKAKEKKPSGDIIIQAPVAATPATEKIDILPKNEEEPKKAVNRKNKIRVISDGNYEDIYSEVYKQLVNKINSRNITSYEISEYVSYIENYKTLINNPEADHILILTSSLHVGFKEITKQLIHAKIGKMSNIIVYLDCSGLDDDEAIELIENDLTEEFDSYEVYPRKTLFVRGNKYHLDITIDNLIDTLNKECSTYLRHTLPFIMTVEEAFHVKKDDTLKEIIHGTVKQGSITAGDKIYLLDADGAPSATAYMMVDKALKDVPTAYPGMSVDIFLDGVPKEAVHKGKIAVASIEDFNTSDTFTAGIYVCTKAEGGHYTPFYNGMSFTLIIDSREYPAVISQIFKDEMIDPGNFGTIEIQAEEPIVFGKKAAFVMSSMDRIIGKGVIY